MLVYLEKILFYLLVFCLPFQTRKIVYQWGGDFNEWTSIYLYLTDILLVFIFLLWILRKKKQRFLKEPLKLIKLKSSSFWLVAFLFISLISLIQARNLQIGFYYWAKLLEMIGLFFYLKYNFKELFSFKKLTYVFIASGLFQSIIIFGQYIQQKSLGLKFLTESPLSPEISGVAKIVVNGVKIIRPYGTFPHPNVLAVFFLICIFFLYFLWLRKEHSFKNYIFLSISFFFLFFALFLTYSRLTMSVLILSSIIYFILLFKKHKKQVLALLLLIVICSSIISFLAWPEISSRFQVSMGDQSVGLRLFYNQTAFSIIQEFPLFGIGFGNFVWEIREMLNLLNPWVHQPVHNIYLLIGSEVGLIGLILLFMFLYQLIRGNCKRQNNEHYLLLFILFSFLFLGLFDHFFWTLQQGQLIFWIVLGLMARNELSTV